MKNFKEMKQVVLNDEHFQTWVHGVGEGTKKNYLYSLTGFCCATSKTPTELLEICKEEYSKPPWERNIRDWFRDYDKYCEETGMALETFRKRKTNVRGFFRFNEIETPRTRRTTKSKLQNANSRQLPTKEELKTLLNATNSIKEKAIILTQFSSGLSNIDLVKLTVGQFRNGLDDNNICTIQISREKNNKEFITFISPEAVEAIEAYLKVERNDLDDDQPLFTQFKSPDKAMRPIAIVHTYARLNDGLGWSKEGNYYRKITGHMGRKWLKTNLANAGMPREPLETILGHELRNGTDDNYYLMNEQQLKSIYIKYLPHITIDPVETLTLESDEYKALKEENKMLKAKLDEIDGRLGSIEEEDRIVGIESVAENLNSIINLANAMIPEDAENREDLVFKKAKELGDELWKSYPIANTNENR